MLVYEYTYCEKYNTFNIILYYTICVEYIISWDEWSIG